jgi:hypothetical protein
MTLHHLKHWPMALDNLKHLPMTFHHLEHIPMQASNVMSLVNVSNDVIPLFTAFLTNAVGCQF